MKKLTLAVSCRHAWKLFAETIDKWFAVGILEVLGDTA
jgi:hypothetical protein